MARTVKNPDERRVEIVKVSLELFCKKGYNDTAVSDIVKKVGIAQGTFYYYFKSKEEVIDSIIEEYSDYINEIIEPVVNDKKLNAVSKLKEILFKEFTLEEGNIKLEKLVQLHFIPDLDIHQKILKSKVVKYSPYVTSIIDQGIKDGEFKTEHARESVEMLLVAFHFLFDPGMLPYDEKEYDRRAAASGHIIENVLMAKKGSFDFFPQLIKNNIRRLHESKKNKFKI